MINCIYKMTSPSGKIYIGQCKDFKLRTKQHIWRSKHPKSSIERAITKYGFSNFKVEFLYLAKKYDKYELNKKEIYYIEFYKSTDPSKGYNLCIGGEGRQGPLSKETKVKMSKSKIDKPSNRKGTPTSEETRKKMSESHKKPHSEYQKRRMSEGLSIPIEQYSEEGNLIKTWSSAKQAITETEICTVRDALHGRQKTAGGFVWQYVDKNYIPSSKKRKK